VNSIQKLLPGDEAPLEIRIAALILGGGGVLFLVASLVWALRIGDTGLLAWPGIIAVVGVALGAGLIAGPRFVRLPSLVWTTLVAIIQLVFALAGAAPWWLLVLCGLLAVGHIYALVLQITLPARHYFGRAR
jgi:hypothetical protein